MQCHSNSSSRSQTFLVTIQNLLYQRYMFVLALKITQSVSFSWKILFYFHHIPLLECDGYELSKWLTCQLLTHSFGTLLKWYHSYSFICVGINMHLQHIYFHTFYSCRGQPRELDIPWYNMQTIGSLSLDSFFVSCLNLENMLSLQPVAGHLEGWYITYLLFSCLDSSTIETNSIRIGPCIHLKIM